MVAVGSSISGPCCRRALCDTSRNQSGLLCWSDHKLKVIRNGGPTVTLYERFRVRFPGASVGRAADGARPLGDRVAVCARRTGGRTARAHQQLVGKGAQSASR
jgi:hypothetical protein